MSNNKTRDACFYLGVRGAAALAMYRMHALARYHGSRKFSNARIVRARVVSLLYCAGMGIGFRAYIYKRIFDLKRDCCSRPHYSRRVLLIVYAIFSSFLLLPFSFGRLYCAPPYQRQRGVSCRPSLPLFCICCPWVMTPSRNSNWTYIGNRFSDFYGNLLSLWRNCSWQFTRDSPLHNNTLFYSVFAK